MASSLVGVRISTRLTLVWEGRNNSLSSIGSMKAAVFPVKGVLERGNKIILTSQKTCTSSVQYNVQRVNLTILQLVIRGRNIILLIHLTSSGGCTCTDIFAHECHGNSIGLYGGGCGVADGGHCLNK